MKSILYCAGAVVLAAACSSTSIAQEVQRKLIQLSESPQQGKEAELVILTEIAKGDAADKFWIGVMATPISDVVKAQLRLKAGLAVSDVVPKSPAAKAGVAAHDILLKYNSKPLTSIESLFAAVGRSDGKAVELVVLRGGSEKKFKVQPAKRPKEHRLTHLGEGAFEWTEKAGQPHRLMFFGPGMQVMPGQNLDGLIKKAWTARGDHKEGTQFRIEKSSGGPAKIIIKRDGKTYEASEDKLNALPAEIRELVKKHMKAHENGQHAGEHHFFVPKGNPFQFAQPRVHLNIPGVQNHNQAMEKQLKQVMEQMERVLKEIESLKKERKERSKRAKRRDTTDA